jgi:hypothetical protein
MDIVADVEGISHDELNAQIWGRPFAEVMSNGEANRYEMQVLHCFFVDVCVSRRLTMVETAKGMVRAEGYPYTGTSEMASVRHAVVSIKARMMG